MTVKNESPPRKGFWTYLSYKELDQYPTPGLRLWLMLILVFAWTVEQFEKAKMAPVLSYIMEDFDVSLTTWGVVATIATILSALSVYIFGYFSDLYGRKKLMIWPMFIYVFLAILTVMAQNFMTVAVFYVLGLVIISGLYPVVAAAFRDVSPRSGRAISYSWLSLAFVLGSLTSNGAASMTIPIWPGWRPQYWIAAGVALIMVIIVGFLYKDLSEKVRGKVYKDQTEGLKSETVKQEVSVEEAKRSGNLIYKDWRIWFLNMALLFWGCVYASIMAYVPLYFTQFFGIEPARAASLTNVFWFVAIFSIFFGGWLSDKLQLRKIVSALGAIGTGAMLIILSVLPANTSETILILIWGLSGITMGFIYPAWCALLSENAESISSFGVGRAFAISGIFSAVGGVFLNLGLPVIVENWGWSAWMLTSGFCCFAVALFVSFGRGPWFIPNAK